MHARSLSTTLFFAHLMASVTRWSTPEASESEEIPQLVPGQFEMHPRPTRDVPIPQLVPEPANLQRSRNDPAATCQTTWTCLGKQLHTRGDGSLMMFDSYMPDDMDLSGEPCEHWTLVGDGTQDDIDAYSYWCLQYWHVACHYPQRCKQRERAAHQLLPHRPVTD